MTTVPPTIKFGSSGEHVKRWQQIIKVPANGIFDEDTKQATKDWQDAHKLINDGIVGPITWSIALGATISPTAKTPQASADARAYEIAKRAAPPTMTEREIQYVLAVARGEGFYGGGWANPNAETIKRSQSVGLTGYEGTGSNNWGAEQGTGDAGSFPHIDYHADGSMYVGNYKRWSTPEKGFLSMAKIILGGGMRKEKGAQEIKAAINSGNLRKAVFAQHANKYFELNPEKYLTAVLRNYGILSTNIGWKKMLSENGSIVGAVIGTIAVVIAGILIKRSL